MCCSKNWSHDEILTNSKWKRNGHASNIGSFMKNSYHNNWKRINEDKFYEDSNNWGRRQNIDWYGPFYSGNAVFAHKKQNNHDKYNSYTWTHFSQW